MANHHVNVHEVEFLAATNAKIDGERVVIITIRPELPSFRPHNLSIPRSSAERLLEDLKTILSRSAVCLVLLALAGLTGCSADVEVESETISPRPEADAEVLTTERSRTAVAVDLFRDQGPVLMEEGEPVEVPLDGTLIVEDSCIHFHEHLHIHLCEGDRNAERVALEIVREWTGGLRPARALTCGDRSTYRLDFRRFGAVLGAVYVCLLAVERPTR
jgi:hypothetical protein